MGAWSGTDGCVGEVGLGMRHRVAAEVEGRDTHERGQRKVCSSTGHVAGARMCQKELGRVGRGQNAWVASQ